MLSLHNVSKTYVTKAKTETQALKNVSLDIASRGMVFILGKSGSGKSTLLNLLGGLDAPTSGEIFVDGVSMQQFSQSDYADYRNNYVGFIFQEFNLLADFNVRDNVALALRLTKADDIDVKVSDALKRVELSDDYLNRRIDEMSGGEKQRIAIARALIKDSKLILADEPTGNLDSATGESIWNILKTLSRERLVVVVSHDRESAEKYADRIIEIADGQVILDNGEQPTTKTVSQPQSATKSRLSFMTRLKMGYNNLRLRKAKTVSVILVAIFSILSILITQMCLSFSPEVSLSGYMAQNNVDYFTVMQGYNDRSRGFITDYYKMLKGKTKQYIEDNSNCIYEGVIKSKQDILDFGLTFVGEALELDDYSYYATSTRLEETYKKGSGMVEINGEYVSIVKESHSIDFLIGKKVILATSVGGEKGNLAGVIDVENLVNASALPDFFYNENFDHKGTASVDFNEDEKSKEATVSLGENEYNDKFGIAAHWGIYLAKYSNVIVTADGLCVDINEMELAYNEVVLPYSVYANMFNANSQAYYVDTHLTEARNIPQEIGQTFNLRLYECDTGEVLVDCGEVKLVGVSFSDSNYLSRSQYDIILNGKLYDQIKRTLFPSSILIQASSVENIEKFTTTLRRNCQAWIENAGRIETTERNGLGEYFADASQMAYGFEEMIGYIAVVFIVICAVLTIVFILLVINLISFSIANRKKEIGILSAIGASNADITSIFLLETLIISAISFVCILALALASVSIFNVFFSQDHFLTIVYPYLRVDLFVVATLLISAFGLPLLAALIPICKIIKLKPIDAIRSI